MPDAPQRKPRWRSYAAAALAAVPVAMLVLSGAMKVAGAAPVVRDMSGRFAFPPGAILPIGLLELACTAVYLVPRTAALGAVLLTGFLGGAVATHVHAGEPLVGIAPFLLGVLVWGSLYLREDRVRGLLPLRKGEQRPGS